MLTAKGCCDPETGDVLIDKVERKFTKNEIDIEFLNQTLKPECEYILDDEDLFLGDI
jgi:hypothetical protein